MRIKDLHKQEAIIEATVLLVNEIGFVSSSVSKIAKKAGVSPATIYIYYKNKDDLLVSTYVEIKKKMSRTLLKNLDDSLPIRDILESFWKNGFQFVQENRPLYQYSEQFANSPYYDLVNRFETDKYFEPFIKMLQKGIEQKVIKKVPFDLLATFLFYPIMRMSNQKTCGSLDLNEEMIETGFLLAWDAVKL